MKKYRLALLNMYDGHPNQGMRAIRDILNRFSDSIDFFEFDVRGADEMPDSSFDIFISSGGPGNPLEGDGSWDVRWRKLIDELWEHNNTATDAADKKYVFFICHSFQMACHHFGLGEITRRVVTSFGVYPCHKTKAGKEDRLLDELEDPYYVVDSRDWQLIQPKLNVFKKWGAKILSLEKLRTHLEYERAIMAVRFSDEFVGTRIPPRSRSCGYEGSLFGREEQGRDS